MRRLHSGETVEETVELPAPCLEAKVSVLEKNQQIEMDRGKE